MVVGCIQSLPIYYKTLSSGEGLLMRKCKQNISKPLSILGRSQVLRKLEIPIYHQYYLVVLCWYEAHDKTHCVPIMPAVWDGRWKGTHAQRCRQSQYFEYRLMKADTPTKLTTGKESWKASRFPKSTLLGPKAVPRLGQFCYCSCLPLLPSLPAATWHHLSAEPCNTR